MVDFGLMIHRGPTLGLLSRGANLTALHGLSSPAFPQSYAYFMFPYHCRNLQQVPSIGSSPIAFHFYLLKVSPPLPSVTQFFPTISLQSFPTYIVTLSRPTSATMKFFAATLAFAALAAVNAEVSINGIAFLL